MGEGKGRRLGAGEGEGRRVGVGEGKGAELVWVRVSCANNSIFEN